MFDNGPNLKINEWERLKPTLPPMNLSFHNWGDLGAGWKGGHGLLDDTHEI